MLEARRVARRGLDAARAARSPSAAGAPRRTPHPSSMQLGPARVVLLEASTPATTAAVTAGVVEVLGDHVDDDGHVVLDGAIGILTATA